MEPAPPTTRKLAGRGGFEPPLRGPEPRVLPLDDLPARRPLYRPVPEGVKATYSSTTCEVARGGVGGHRTVLLEELQGRQIAQGLIGTDGVGRAFPDPELGVGGLDRPGALG